MYVSSFKVEGSSWDNCAWKCLSVWVACLQQSLIPQKRNIMLVNNKEPKANHIFKYTVVT